MVSINKYIDYADNKIWLTKILLEFNIDTMSTEFDELKLKEKYIALESQNKMN